MPIINKDDVALGIPAGSILCIKVVTDSKKIDATGTVDHPDGSVTNVSHGSIMGRTKRITLEEPGNHFARVNLIFNAQKEESATVEYTLEDDQGAQIASFKPTFKGKAVGKDKLVGRAKWSIEIT